MFKLIGLITGAVIVAVIALLFMPREQLAQMTLQDVREEAQTLALETAEMGEQILAETQAQLERLNTDEQTEEAGKGLEETVPLATSADGEPEQVEQQVEVLQQELNTYFEQTEAVQTIWTFRYSQQAQRFAAYLSKLADIELFTLEQENGNIAVAFKYIDEHDRDVVLQHLQSVSGLLMKDHHES